MEIKKYLAEFLGAFLLTFAVIASLQSGFPLVTPVVAGLTIALVVYTLGGVSGAHINPAVTLGLWAIKKISLSNGLIYIVVQTIGAWLAGAFAAYLFDFSNTLTVANTLPVFLGEAIGAFVLVLAVCGVVLRANSQAYSGLAIGGALTLGASIASIVSNGVLNPAVALGIGSIGLVYILGPIVGAVVAALLARYLISEPNNN